MKKIVVTYAATEWDGKTYKISKAMSQFSPLGDAIAEELANCVGAPDKQTHSACWHDLLTILDGIEKLRLRTFKSNSIVSIEVSDDDD